MFCINFWFYNALCGLWVTWCCSSRALDSRWNGR